MEKRTTNILIAVFILLLMALVSYAAVPQTMNYQGYLTDANGSPVNGTVAMTFALYNVQRGGSPLWNEVQLNVTVNNGLYDVILGSVTPINLPFDAQYYLGVTIGTDAEMTPRQALTSVGYSMRAGIADSASYQAIGTSALTNGAVTDVKIAGPISASKIIQGTGSTLDADMVDGKHAANLVLKAGDTMTGTLNLPANGLTVGTNQLVVSGSKVGIGTAAPNEQLEITGNLRLPVTGTIKSGANTLIHTYGSGNFFAGVNAGNLTMTGNYNTASGYRALSANTTGTYNTASGNLALDSNTTGSVNTAIGASALYYNTTGNYNTASGYYALGNNITGSQNTAGGMNALGLNTTASKNTALGTSALYTQSYDNAGTAWDSHNTAVGFESLYSNQPTSTSDGRHNTALGSQALRSNTRGYDNTASGDAALYSNTTGYNNTASGAYALYSNTTGYDNTASGTDALDSNTTGSVNTASGYRALSANTTGNYNTASGTDALLYNTTGSYNTAIGTNALFSNNAGSYNTAIGHFANVSPGDLTNATAIGYDASVNASNKVVIGNNAVTSIGGYAAWSNFSDLRSKTDIQDIGYGLDFVRQLRPVSFKMKNGNGNTDFGFVAQDIEALLGGKYNVLDIGGGEERMLSLRYSQFIAPMVRAMQEQQEIIESQQAKIQSLEERLARFEALMGGK